MNDASIVLASLDDQKLKDSISSLVKNVNEGMDAILKKTNSTVSQMENRLRSLGKLDIGGSADGGSSNRTRKLKEEKAQIDANTEATKKKTQAEKELTLTLDQQAQARQKAARMPSEMRMDAPKSARDSFYVFQSTLTQRSRELVTEIKNAEAAFNTALDIKLQGKQLEWQRKLEQTRQKLEQFRENLGDTRTVQQMREEQRLVNLMSQQQAMLDKIRGQRSQMLQPIMALRAEETKVLSAMHDVEQGQKRQLTEEQNITSEIKKRAEEIRKSKQWQETKSYQWTDESGTTYRVAEGKKLGTIEEQLLNIKKRQTDETQQQIRADQQAASVEQSRVHIAETMGERVRKLTQEAQKAFSEGKTFFNTGLLGGEGLPTYQHGVVYSEKDTRSKGLTIEEQILKIVQDQEKVYAQEYETVEKINQSRSKKVKDDTEKAYKEYVGRVAGLAGVDATAIDFTSSKISQMTANLKHLQSAYANLSREERSSSFGKTLKKDIQDAQRELQKLRNEMSRPLSLGDAMKLPAKTLDDIQYKIRQLQSYKMGIDITKPNAKNEIMQVDEAINKLQKDMNKYMNTSKSVIEQNNALGRSWNYMKNRLAFYFTVGASTQFVKNLIEVRSQYEMNERALGILIGSAEYGTKVFNELSQMSLISPYTLIELSAAAKQLTAYGIAARDVVDTTRRLADMASAVGVPIERLTYALGQIQAYGYLNSRDQRMFANAGIPLAAELAKYYTEIEGKLVSTGDVYDRIKKKAVDYADVMQVVYRMTDQGGQFFDFQAKMADTLKVRIANLTLAWNNMLNEMGKSEQGVLTTGIGLLKDLFLKWRDVEAAVKSFVYAFGVLKVLQFTVLKGLSTQAEVAAWKLDGTTKGFAKLTNAANAFKSSMLSMAANPWTWVFVGITAIISLANAYEEAKEKARAFNSSLREGGVENVKNINSYLESMESLRKKLEQVQLDETNSPKKTSTGAIATVKTNIDESEAEKAWEAMREQIELASSSSSVYIQRLLQIENVSERLREGFAILENIKAVNQALSEVSDNTFKVEQSFSGWWNLWTLQDGLIQNLKDYNDALEGTSSVMSNVGKDAVRLVALGAPIGSIANASIAINERAISQWKELKSNIESTTESLKNFIAQRNWSSDPEKIQELYGQFTQKLALENQLDPKTAYYLQLLLEEGRTKATKEALVARMNDEYEAWKIETDEVAKMQLKASYDRHAEELNTFNQTTAKERVEWSEFTKYMANNHKSEIASMFRGMDEEQIKSLNFQEGEYKKWVDRMVKDYAKAHKMSYDEAFGYLKHWVQNANMWSIFIKLTISTEDGKSAFDALKELDQQVDDADAQIKRLERRQKELLAIKKRTFKEEKELGKVTTELEQARKDKQKAEGEGGHGKQEDKDAKKASADAKKRAREAAKAQREAETELQKTLKNELSLIDKLRSSYKALTDEGVSQGRALEIVTSGFGETVKAINDVLVDKWGLAAFDPNKFAGITNPRELVKLLEDQLNALVKTGRAKPIEIQDLQAKVKDLKVDAAKFDTKMVAEGLNNELGQLKDEYELAVALDADPELGALFTEMFNINTSEFPKTLQQMVEKTQNAVSKAINDAAKASGGKLGDFNVVKGNLENWAKENNIDITSDLFGKLKSAQEQIRKLIRSDFEETSKSWDKLLEKYAEYQYKQTKIAKEANQERLAFVKKFGEPEQIASATTLVAQIETEKDSEKKEILKQQLKNLIASISEDNKLLIQVSLAIDERELREQAKLSFEEFQKTPEWIVATGDLADMSKKAIGSLISKIEEYRRSAKNLSPKQIKEINKALKNLYKEQRKNNPFASIGNMLDEAKDRMAVYDEEIAKVEKQIEDATDTMETFIDVNGDGAEEQKNKLDKLIDKWKKLKESQNEAGEIDASSWVSAINETIGAVKQAIGVFNDLAKAIGGVEENDLDKVFEVLEKAGEGAAIGAQIGGAYGAIIGGLAGAATSLIKIFVSASDERITEQIKNSERAVKRLENVYKSLEHTATNAYGAIESGAKRALRSNKELQLAQLERQLQLEESRDSKDQDEDKIIDLRGQINELRNDINDVSKDIVNDLLGISSAGDGIEGMVSSMIDAFRNGEDVMKAFGDSFDEMVDNMILKLVVTQFMQKAWDNLLKNMENKEEQMLKQYADTQAQAQAHYDDVRNYSDEELRKIIANERYGFAYGLNYSALDKVSQEEIDAYRKAAEEALTNSTDALNNASLEYTKWSLDYMNTEGRDYLTQYATLLKDSLGNWYKYGENKETSLSALQQGISQITEDTAGALEAITTGMYQQICLQSDLLTQIRDAINGFSMDEQLGVVSQILFQLQASYQVQMSIKNTLDGVLNPSGRAFSVELIS